MNPRHHLSASTVISYAAGALPLELAVVVAAHLETCRHCREQVRTAEQLGGLFLEQQRPAPLTDARRAQLRESMLERISDASSPDATGKEFPRASPIDPDDRDRLPLALQTHFGKSYRELKWRWMAPGVHCIRSSFTRNLFLLKIGPGKSMPVHSHGSCEVTQILQGSYRDALGSFEPGDVADLDSSIEHQPVTTPGVPCVCVSALDAPLRFPGWFARKLQPFVGL